MAVGKEALGNATILGGSINPLQVFMMQQAQQSKNDAAVQAQKRKDRDSVMDYADKYNPETKFTQLNQRLGDSVEAELRAPVRQVLETGDVRKADMLGKRLQANLDSRRREYDAWKQTYDEASKIVEDNIKSGRFDPSARSVIRDTLFDNEGRLKPDNDIRAGIAQIESIVDHPKNLNPSFVARSFMNTLDEQATEQFKKQIAGDYDVTSTLTSKLNYRTKLNPNGVVEFELDKNGNKILNDISPDVYRLANANPDMRQLMEMHSIEKTGKPDDENSQKEFLKQVLPVFDKTEQKFDLRNKPNTNDLKEKITNSKWGIDFGHKIEDLEARRDITDKIVNRKNLQSIGALGNLIKGSKAEYSADGKKIILTFKANLADPKFDPNNLEQLKDAYIKNTYNKGKQEVTSDIDISTPEARKRAQYYLSEILDSQNPKTSIGADRFDRYLEAYDKNNKTGKTKIAGF